MLLFIVSGFIANAFADPVYTPQMIEQLQFPGTRTCVTAYGTAGDSNHSFFEIVCGSNRLAFGTVADDVELLPVIFEKMAQQGYHTECSHSEISGSLVQAGANTIFCIHQNR